jgi:hypothetical protein
MEIDKQKIIQLLRERGEHDKADAAEKKLPDTVDHEQHSGLLGELGVDAKELIGKL